MREVRRRQVTIPGDGDLPPSYPAVQEPCRPRTLPFKNPAADLNPADLDAAADLNPADLDAAVK
ncbi:hypothetical protein [Arthrobacter sp. CG_A4]|uniref:hypothetical protein n=1 Tax=Arthrobacter sp. CG_A4 TaxID=3071706 RepID=UPI002DFDFE2A|nr:hypothetical protein [Arthrobacter sp. CG_A4]